MKHTMFVIIPFVLIAFTFAENSNLKHDIIYDSKYDNVDLDEILKSKRLLDNYVKCLLDEGPCTPDGNELKRHLPDAIETNCSKCTEKQKNGSEKVIRFIIDNRPIDWTRMESKYDPEEIYKKRYLDEKQRNETLATSTIVPN